MKAICMLMTVVALLFLTNVVQAAVQEETTTKPAIESERTTSDQTVERERTTTPAVESGKQEMEKMGAETKKATKDTMMSREVQWRSTRTASDIQRDRQVTQRISDELGWTPEQAKNRLFVISRGGDVYLYGRVDSESQKDRIEKMVSSMPGVEDVHNQVLAGRWDQMNDREITENIQNEYFWSFVADGDEINVKVNDGIATLSGSVSSEAELRAAVKNAFDGGAKGVISDLKVKESLARGEREMKPDMRRDRGTDTVY